MSTVEGQGVGVCGVVGDGVVMDPSMMVQVTDGQTKLGARDAGQAVREDQGRIALLLKWKYLKSTEILF